MKRVYLYPYKMGSRSATILADALDIYQIKHENSKFKGRQNKTVINWGSSELPYEVGVSSILNDPTGVSVVSNKKSYFTAASNISHDLAPRLVPWTESQTEAKAWIEEGFTVVARTLLTSHSGRGIILVEPEDELPDAPLYTKYIKKDSEWRIHCFRNQNIVFRQRKIKDPSIEEPKNWQIRNHNNGFIFQQNDLKIPEDVEKQALLAFNASGLDFGAIDVIFNAKQGQAYVLEINSAPGLEGTTVGIYVEAFRKLITI